MKKPLVVSALVLALAVGSSVFALQPKPVKHFSPNTVTVTAPTVTTTETPAAPVVQPAPVVQETPETPVVQPAVKTVDDLKAEALTTIGDPNQFHCFDQLIDMRYSWNLDETEMLKRIDTLKVYSNYCVGLQFIRTNYPRFPEQAPGFRD